MKRTGLLHLYYGDGKGKTTAAMGLALRAMGSGKRVVILQFLKGGKSGEVPLLEQLGAKVYRGKAGQKFVFQMNEAEKEATRQRAEAQRIQIETQAAADAEKTRLQGEGQANYRREIANGIVDQIKSLQAVGMDINDVNNVVLFNQYLDVMRSLSESKNTKTVVLPASTPRRYQSAA